MFVREAGSSLSSVHSIDLILSNTGTSAVTSAALDAAVVMLMMACPALMCLHATASMSRTLVEKLGQACPQLSDLSICTSDSNTADIQRFVDQIPTLLPTVNDLCFHMLGGDKALPDMSQIMQVTSLGLIGYTITSENEWRCLPPKLQHFHCGHVEIGPSHSSSTDTAPLRSLTSFDFSSGKIKLRTLTQILRAAPAALQCLYARDSEEATYLQVHCCLNSTAAADLCFIQETHPEAMRKPVFCFECATEERETTDLLPFFTALPCMPGVMECDVKNLRVAELGQIIRMFPGLRGLVLHSMPEMGDVELQVLETCAKLVFLGVRWMDNISPMGLLSLCHRQPSLRRVRCTQCVQLKEPVLNTCVTLLRRDVLITETDDGAENDVMSGAESD